MYLYTFDSLAALIQAHTYTLFFFAFSPSSRFSASSPVFTLTRFRSSPSFWFALIEPVPLQL